MSSTEQLLEFIRYTQNRCDDGEDWRTYDEIAEIIRQHDAMQKTGKWIQVRDKNHRYNMGVKCSICGRRVGNQTYGHTDYFCPKCGTKMGHEEWGVGLSDFDHFSESNENCGIGG